MRSRIYILCQGTNPDKAVSLNIRGGGGALLHVPRQLVNLGTFAGQQDSVQLRHEVEQLARQSSPQTLNGSTSLFYNRFATGLLQKGTYRFLLFSARSDYI